MQQKQKLLVYLPVIHAGYMKFFENHPDADILIASRDLIELIDQEFDYLRKEIRAITPVQAEISLESLLPDRNISLIGANDLELLNTKDQNVILPNEDIFIWLSKTHLPKANITFDTTFLRWNRTNTVEKNEVPTKTNTTEFLEKIKKLAETDAEFSSDWWRQVSAIAFKDGAIIAIAHNQHLPSPYTPYIDSDPRNSFHKGEHINLSTAIHAEAGIVADCAKNGVSLDGSALYVSTFPCPVCAKQIATSGIKTVYFSEGYAMLDGETVLTNAGVTIEKV